MKSVDYIAATLKQRGLCLWTFPGGTIYPLYDACHRFGVKTVVARSESGAGYMAIGAAKATGETQVVAVTSGPGVTNLVTAIADAYYDGVPIVALTGQVGTAALRETDHTRKRQAGFQQTPATKIMEPISVAAYRPLEPRKLALCFGLALQDAVHGDRMGPVVVDMPLDVQRGEIKQDIQDRQDDDIWKVEPPDAEGMDRVAELLNSARSPVIIAGAGCLGAAQALRVFAKKYAIPVTASLPAVGIMPTDDVLWLGMLGHTGHAGANMAVYEADLILALGTRLDVRQTGTETDRFAPQARIVRVDTSSSELNGARTRISLNLPNDCGEVLMALLKRDDLTPYPSPTRRGETPRDEMAELIIAISDAAPVDCIFTTGVGAHQQHAARWLRLDYPRRMFLTSAGHGAMGAGLPMAIGAALATGRKAVVIDGDGSFQMSMNELGTIAQYGLQDQIEIHIIDNGSGGIVSQFARLQGWNPKETTWTNPRFETIAAAYGLHVNVHQVKEEGVWPILEAGHAMNDMTERSG